MDGTHAGTRVIFNVRYKPRRLGLLHNGHLTVIRFWHGNLMSDICHAMARSSGRVVVLCLLQYIVFNHVLLFTPQKENGLYRISSFVCLFFDLLNHWHFDVPFLLAVFFFLSSVWNLGVVAYAHVCIYLSLPVSVILLHTHINIRLICSISLPHSFSLSLSFPFSWGQIEQFAHTFYIDDYLSLIHI